VRAPLDPCAACFASGAREGALNGSLRTRGIRDSVRVAMQPPPRSSSRVAWVAILSGTLVFLLLARYGLRAFPASGDEHSYLLQGQLFAHGRLSIAAPSHPELFQVDHVVLDAAVRSKYPPGWPALLALGWLASAPWIVNPILGGACLALVHAIARRLYGTDAALVATLLLACSPFFALNAASYHVHVSALLCEAAYAYALLRGARTASRDTRWAALAGVPLGCLFLTRPFDAVLAALALAVFFRSPRFILACVATAAPIGALFLAYDAAQFGSPWTTGYTAFAPVSDALWGPRVTVSLSPRYAVDPAAQWDHVGLFVSLGQWLVPAFMLLALVGLAMPKERGVAERFLLALAISFGLGIIVQGFGGGDSYGPRYLFPLLVPMALAAGASWVHLSELVASHPSACSLAPARRAQASWLALSALLVGGAARTGVFAAHAHAENLARGSLYRQVTALGLDRAVVVVKADSPTYFTRNLSVLDGPVIYVSTALAKTMTDGDVAKLFPDRTAYAAVERDGSAWTISRIE